MNERMRRCLELVRCAMLIGLFAWTPSAVAQDTTSRGEHVLPASTESSAGSSSETSNDSIRDLQREVRELQSAVAALRTDWLKARSETAELRQELDEVRAAVKPQKPTLISVAATSDVLKNVLQDQEPQNENPNRDQEQKKNEHADRLQEEYQLLSGKVDDQYQTKVESASKYRLRLSGIVLMNLASNQGTLDSIDLPTVAYARPSGSSRGSFGATLRQSELGFEAFGPNVAGAKTTADLQLDFAGGFPSVPNGISSGLLRLRTGTLRMDWTNTSLVAGQDNIFFSPNSPTSFASLAIPALSYAGNLWGWVPQIRVEHRILLGEESSLLFQGGILNPQSGEAPGSASSASYYRQAGPGESSRQPAYGTRIAWTRDIFGQPMKLGIGGYYSRQDYGFKRNVDGWAGMADVDLPLSHRFSLSGKFYRGKALGGLYGGIGRSVLFSDNPALASTAIEALNTIGGWAQLKFRPANKWEFNVAAGTDNPYARDLKYFPYAQSYGDPALARNQAGFTNLIYRPRSDVLFSAEYRRITTYSLTEGKNSAGQINLVMGVLF